MKILLDKERAELLYTDLLGIYNSDNNFTEKIRQLRVMLESIYSDLTSDAIQSFSNVFQRICYIKEKYNIDNNLQKDINNLRLYANKLIHTIKTDEHNENLKIKKFCVTLCKVIYEFSGVEIISEFKLIENEVRNIKLEEKPKTEREHIAYLKTVVLSVSKLKFSEKGKKYYTIHCQDVTDTDRKLNINIYEPLSENVTSLYPFCNLDIYSLNKIPEKDNLYTSTQDTLLVVDGDYLIDVTTIAECFVKSRRDSIVRDSGLGLLKRFITSETSPAILIGKIVNEILDNYLTSEKKSVTDITNKILIENIWTTLRLKPDEIASINEKVQSQLKNISDVTEKLKGFDFIIEPYFISPYFGIQGRLDVLYRDLKNNEINILELKSGSPPNYDLWINNKMQVIGYNLLLASVYGSDRKGTSAIFYSAAAKDFLRYCRNDIYHNQIFMEIRNKLVHHEHQISEGDFSEMEKLKDTDLSEFPGFSKDLYSAFFSKYNSANPLLRKYFLHFTKFIFKEIKTLKTGSDSFNEFPNYGFSGLWEIPLSQKEFQNDIISGLNIKSYNPETGFFECIIPETCVTHNFRVGDIGILYPNQNNNISPIKNELFKCKIESFDSRIITVSLRNKQVNIDRLLNEKEWVLEHDIMEAGYNYQLQSLFDFLSTKKQDLLFGFKKPSVTKYNFHSDELNENQNNIVAQALSADDYYILQGPPGTGKTSRILINIAASMIKDENRFGNFAILAYTNRAVNEIAQNLIKNNIPFIRLGDDGTDNEYLLNKIVEENSLEEIKKIINENRIILSTIHSFINKRKEISAIKNIETIIIDEAGQVTEPQVIGILSDVKRFILIGDHKQLPAVVMQSEKFCKVEDKDMNSIGIYDMRLSLFERLFETCKKNNWTESYGTLEYHFRMHEQIAELINYNYNKNLKPGLENQSDKKNIFSDFNSDLAKKLSVSRTIFIPTISTTDESAGQEEAEKIGSILNEIYQSGKKVDEDFLGIVTPWRKQITRINKAIFKLPFYDKIQIDTIERFQGLEKEITFFSLCIYNLQQLKNIQSITFDKKTDRKLNVAISRAKKNVIIFGNDNILVRNRFYKKLIKMISENGGYVKL
jgi:hypothetical protein